jgi:transposase
VVVSDDLGARESAEAAARIGAAGRRLPPYSPDLNPIEKVFSKAKGLPRFAAARTKAAPRDAIAFALDAVTAEDCRNLSRSRGYTLRQT